MAIDAPALLGRVRQHIESLRPTDADVRRIAPALRQDGDALCGALPPQFSKVLHDLLDRLESSALFAEESCSFSRDGLLDNLVVWADKAGGRLAAPGAG
ncbi:MAG: hypothetical protein J0H69_06280 [Burkholderiales bacterium]|nr:hypothetical protein [Burkholderiales bacterium]